ncbi:MAG: zinc-binding dehydrogenase [Oscillospiraceae bacterium]|nr:zinc-binding dehydrogenase [Oscillospiraceae bacterium]
MEKTMHGIVKEQAGPGFTYREDIPVPVISDDEILFKVHCTALCGTDVHMYEWNSWAEKRMTPPVVAGHETCGHVVEVGKNVKGFEVGDMVSVETHGACGKCYYCTHDLAELCSNQIMFGVNTNGGFAEYAKVKASSAYKYDPSIPDEMACMFEPMGAGVHGVEAGHVEGKTVLIGGLGAIGMTAVKAAKVLGAKTVIATARADSKLETAKALGADFVVNRKTQNLVEEVMKLTDGVGVDVVIEVTGVESSIHECLKCVHGGGRFVGVGLPTKPVTFDLTEEILYREIEFTGVSGRRIWGTWDNFAKVMRDPGYKLEYIIGEKFAMKDYEKAIERLRSNAPGKNILYP